MALMIADNESGYEPHAQNDASSAAGIFQWLASSWPKSNYPKMVAQWDLEGGRMQARTAAFISLKVMAGPGGFQPWCGSTDYC